MIFADSKEDKLVSLLRSIDGRRKIGVFGNDSSSLAFAVNQLQHQTPQPLNAVVTVAKEPISFDPADRIKELPLQSPTLVVFQNVSYTQKHSPTPAEQLSQLWGSAISKDGGIHSHGFHKDEAQVIDAGSSKDDEIMQPVCKFFVKHLRSA